MPSPSAREWFANVSVFAPRHDLDVLRAGIKAGFLDLQNEYGSTAISLACSKQWLAGIKELLRAGADTELRYFRTGTTVLYHAVLEKRTEVIKLLVAGGANPDAPNYWGITPRKWAPEQFKDVPVRPAPLPPPYIQNAEHLADHYHPRFEIPEREERECLQPGQAVDLYVYGPKSKEKQDTIKVRITAREGTIAHLRYKGTVETPLGKTHLLAGTSSLEFAPEHVATVYLQKARKKGTAPD